MDEFRAGVTACLRSWSALRTAVQNEWGGPTSIEKAEVLRNEIISSISSKNAISDIIDLEDALAIYMEEEFSIVLDDGSEKQVADCIWHMYHECSSGNTALVFQVIQMAEKVTKEFGHLPLHLQSSEPMDDDDDDDANNTDPNAMDTTNTGTISSSTETSIQTSSADTTTLPVHSMSEYGNQPLFGLSREQKRLMIIQSQIHNQPIRQLGEPIKDDQQNDVEIDDDGFVSVATKRKGSRKHI